MIVRKCRGNVHAMILLNRTDFAALDHLLESYIITEKGNPGLERLRDIRAGFRKTDKNLVGIDLK